MSRDYRHLEEAGITLTIAVGDGKARVALAACNPEDPYSRDAGRNVTNALLDGDDATLRAFQLNRNVVCFPYDKEKPRLHILKPLINYLADELGERVFFRQLHSMFMNGIVTQGIAAQVAQRSTNDKTYYKFKQLAELLDEESMELLETLEDEAQFYQAFFNWRGSVDCIMSKLRSFATAVYTKEIALEDPSSEDKPTRVAPRRPVANPNTFESANNGSSEKISRERKETPEPERAVAATPVKVAIKK